MLDLPTAAVAGLTLAALPAARPATAASWGDCELREAREAVESTAGVTRVEVEAKAGKLTIHGREGVSELRATGSACADERAELDQVLLKVERRGETLRVVTELPRRGQARLDLELELPRGIALDVRDSSGSLEVSGVGSTRIEDGSGSIEVSDVSGDLEIRDGSGSIRISEVEGDVRLEDGSGSIDVEGVRGSVLVDEDGSGSIRITRVARDVRVREDGSGGIVVRDVGGDLRVDDAGRGGVRYSDVKGVVELPRGR